MKKNINIILKKGKMKIIFSIENIISSKYKNSIIYFHIEIVNHVKTHSNIFQVALTRKYLRSYQSK